MNIFGINFAFEKYFIVTYFLEGKTSLKDAAWQLAIGQSVGNPMARSEWESEKLFRNHSVRILADEKELEKINAGYVSFAFPLNNIDLHTDGISQLLCQLMGGQMDIDNITKCWLEDIIFSESVIKKYFNKPKYGFSATRKITSTFNKPLLGGIIKPKVVDDINVLERMVNEMIEGGINFIKEDEIMSNPSSCPLDLRVKRISKIIDQTDVIYTYCINSDNVVERAKQVYELGGKGVHVNIWSGLGSYKAIRDLGLPLFIHFQKSGDLVFTNPSNDYHIKWKVICKLAAWMGVDSIHAGMWGGYKNDNENELKSIINMLNEYNVIPALSCGMHAGLIKPINERFGIDYMANVGGAIHGNPHGTKAGVLAMRQTIDLYENDIRRNT